MKYKAILKKNRKELTFYGNDRDLMVNKIVKFVLENVKNIHIISNKKTNNDYNYYVIDLDTNKRHIFYIYFDEINPFFIIN